MTELIVQFNTVTDFIKSSVVTTYIPTTGQILTITDCLYQTVIQGYDPQIYSIRTNIKKQYFQGGTGDKFDPEIKVFIYKGTELVSVLNAKNFLNSNLNPEGDYIPYGQYTCTDFNGTGVFVNMTQFPILYNSNNDMTLYVQFEADPSLIAYTELPLKKFLTNDNATLYYYERKALSTPVGTILILPGWSQDPSEFSAVLNTNEFIKNNYDVYILTARGYNLSECDYGNNTFTYATDFIEFIKAFNLSKITLWGHSMGASTYWSAKSILGQDVIQRFIFDDQGTILLQNPTFTPEEIANYSAIFTPEAMFNLYNGLAASQESCRAVVAGFEPTLFTEWFRTNYPDILNKVVASCQKYYYKANSNVILQHICNNYLDMAMNNLITLPSLLIGGQLSLFDPQCMRYAQRYYPNSQLFIFTAEEHGSHMAFLENPRLTNKVVCNFLINM